MMNQLGKRRPDDSVAKIAQPQAEINVVERNWQVYLVQTTRFVINLMTNRHARAGNSRERSRYAKLIQIPSFKLADKSLYVYDRAIRSQNHSSVLEPSIGIQKLRSDCTHFRPYDVRYHLAEPVRRNYLGIVVEEQQDLAPGFLSRRVVHGRIVEYAWMFQDANPAVSFLDRSKEGQSIGFLATVVDDEQLQAWIICSTEHALDALL